MGYGDEIMITGYAKVLKKEYPNHQIVAGNKKKGIVVDTEIFNNNPNIKRFSELENIQTLWIDSYSGHRPYFIKETDEKYYWNVDHRVAVGEIYLSEDEKLFAKKVIEDGKNWWFGKSRNQYKKIIFIEPSRIKTIKNNASQNRDWGIEKWQLFINIFKDKFLFIQSVFPGSNSLNGVFEFEGSFREACAVLKNCDYSIGMEGGFSHATAALNKVGLFIYGGWIDPIFIGYSNHENVYINIDGSPCGMKVECDHCKKCNELMTVEMIEEKFTKMVEE